MSEVFVCRACDEAKRRWLTAHASGPATDRWIGTERPAANR